MLTRRTYKVVVNDTTLGAKTTNPQYVGDAHRVGVLLRRSAGGTGNTVFTFQGGVDGADGVSAPFMFPLNYMVENVVNTNAQNVAHIQSKTLSAVSSDVVWLDYNAILDYLEVDYNSTTDGTVSITLIVEQDV